jgi:predicted peptidase
MRNLHAIALAMVTATLLTAGFHGSVRNEVSGRFLLYLPKNFKPHGSQRYPLLVFLHGSGESGTDIQLVKVNGPPKFLESRTDFPFIVVSPQADSAAEGFNIDALTVLLTQLKRQLPIDADRVYLTGLSMGGFMTYYWASRHPGLFAAIAPISSGWRAEDGCLFKSMPVWAFHGAKDDVVKLEDDQHIVDAIKACGGDIRFTVYPEAGHNAWEPAYDDPKLYEWLLSHRRAQAH